MMRITVLMDDHPGQREDLLCEHGLSLFLQTPSGNVLFDCGSTGAFIRNAKALGIDLSAADAVVLSHGHYDHAGGFPAFAGEYPGVGPLYTGKGFFDPKYSRDGEKLYDRGSGFDSSLPEKQGFLHREVDAVAQILPGVYLISGFPRETGYEEIPTRFLRQHGGGFCQDDFSDEVCLAVQTESGLAVLVGCSHPGLVNMLAAVRARLGQPVRAVFGGTHLLDAGEARIQKTTQALKAMGAQRIGLCHCTGQAAHGAMAQDPAFDCLDLRCGDSVMLTD